MHELLKPENVYLMLFFFFPGFISLKVYDHLVPNERRKFSHDFFDAIAYGAINLVIISPLIYYTISKMPENILVIYVVAVFSLVICPIIWPFLFHKVTASNGWSKWFISPVKRPWDWFFSKKKSMWVIVHLHDGKKIGGAFGENFCASLFPAREQIYLEEVWNLDADGGFESKMERTGGIMILGGDISSIAFFNKQSEVISNEQET